MKRAFVIVDGGELKRRDEREVSFMQTRLFFRSTSIHLLLLALLLLVGVVLSLSLVHLNKRNTWIERVKMLDNQRRRRINCSNWSAIILNTTTLWSHSCIILICSQKTNRERERERNVRSHLVMMKPAKIFYECHQRDARINADHSVNSHFFTFSFSCYRLLFSLSE